MPITTREALHEHLELAIQVELTTVPPYLYAMYSIADQRSESALLLRSIVAEEMLHAVLASNVLSTRSPSNSVGPRRTVARGRFAQSASTTGVGIATSP